MSIRDAMAKFGISQTTAYKWLKADKAGKAGGTSKVAPAPSLEAIDATSEAVSLAVAVIRYGFDEDDLSYATAQKLIGWALRAGWHLEKP